MSNPGTDKSSAAYHKRREQVRRAQRYVFFFPCLVYSLVRAGGYRPAYTSLPARLSALSGLGTELSADPFHTERTASAKSRMSKRSKKRSCSCVQERRACGVRMRSCGARWRG